MSFFELLEGHLSELDIPYYEGQPEFEGSPPETFISYSVYDVPGFYGCGKELVTTYYVTINIYAEGVDRALVADNVSEALTNLLTNDGFVRESGTYGLTDDFPRYYHKIIKFNYAYRLL